MWPWTTKPVFGYTIVWVKIIDFSFMPKIIRILIKDHVSWRYFVNFLSFSTLRLQIFQYIYIYMHKLLFKTFMNTLFSQDALIDQKWLKKKNLKSIFHINAILLIFLLFSVTVQPFSTVLIITMFLEHQNQNIRMISEGSCDTEYWSNFKLS